METHALRFKVELALNGMKDGQPSQAYPAHMRLEQLLDFKKSWPALHWSHEDVLEIPCPTIKGVSGGIFYHASENSTYTTYQWTLELYELRSFRIGRPRNDQHLHYLKLNVPFDIKALVIDPTQNLLVLVEMDEPMQYVHLTYFCQHFTCSLPLNYAGRLIYVFGCIFATCGQAESTRTHLLISTFIIPIVGAPYMLVYVCGFSKSKFAGIELL